MLCLFELLALDLFHSGALAVVAASCGHVASRNLCIASAVCFAVVAEGIVIAALGRAVASVLLFELLLFACNVLCCLGNELFSLVIVTGKVDRRGAGIYGLCSTAGTGGCIGRDDLDVLLSLDYARARLVLILLGLLLLYLGLLRLCLNGTGKLLLRFGTIGCIIAIGVVRAVLLILNLLCILLAFCVRSRLCLNLVSLCGLFLFSLLFGLLLFNRLGSFDNYLAVKIIVYACDLLCIGQLIQKHAVIVCFHYSHVGATGKALIGEHIHKILAL